MSSLLKVASGTLASWIQILLTLSTNLLLVPLFLKHWDTTTYGCWLAVQALFATLQVIDFGHQQNLARTCNLIDLKLLRDYARLLSSALCVGQFTAFLQFAVVATLTLIGRLGPLLGIPAASDHLLQQVSILLCVQTIAYFLLGNASVILSRGIVPFGYYSNGPWFGSALSALQLVTQAACLHLGMGLLSLGLTSVVASLLIYAAIILNSIWILRRNGVRPVSPDWSLGFRNLKRSLVLSFVNVIGTLRQQGIRLLLPGMVSLAGLTQFATTRTVANVVMQAGTSILWPFSPLLMRVLRERNQVAFEACISFLWLFILIGLCPGLILLGSAGGPVFHLWTHDKVPYDPVLLGIFSSGALAFCASQTSLIIIGGYNPLRSQLSLSIINSVVLLGTFFLFTKLWSLRGAGFSIMITEIFNIALASIIAKSLIETNGLTFPIRLYFLGFGGVLMSIVVILLISLFSTHTLIILCVFFTCLGLSCWMILRRHAAGILELRNL